MGASSVERSFRSPEPLNRHLSLTRERLSSRQSRNRIPGLERLAATATAAPSHRRCPRSPQQASELARAPSSGHRRPSRLTITSTLPLATARPATPGNFRQPRLRHRKSRDREPLWRRPPVWTARPFFSATIAVPQQIPAGNHGGTERQVTAKTVKHTGPSRQQRGGAARYCAPGWRQKSLPTRKPSLHATAAGRVRGPSGPDAHGRHFGDDRGNVGV